MDRITKQLMEKFEQEIIPNIWIAVETSTDGMDCYHKMIQLMCLSFSSGVRAGAELDLADLYE